MGLTVAHAPGQLDHRELRAEDGARLLELPDHRRIEIEALLAERRRAPRRRDAARRRQQILGAIGDAVERPTVAAGGDLLLGPPRLLHRALARAGDHGIVAGAEPLEA